MTIELILRRDPEDNAIIHLCAPEVGLYTNAPSPGALLQPGEVCGVINRLGQTHDLVVPPGARGRVTNAVPSKVHEPVDFGRVLVSLEPIGDTETDQTTQGESEASASGLALFAPITGRFWHRPSPDEPAFCQVGDELEPGAVVGLVEIMKTFTQVTYSTTGGLPAKARVTRMCVPDGGEVTEGEALIEVEAL